MKDEALRRPLPDATPPPRSWDVAFRAAVQLAVLAGILLEIVPRFSDVYRQIKIPMPAPTELLMRLGDGARAGRWGVVLAVLLAPWFLTRLSKRAASRVELVLLLLFVTALVGMLFALFCPLMSITEGIGAKK